MVFSHKPRRGLLSLPPEILLTIISHLPTSSALYTLSFTSRTLSTFIHTHAATICNNRIQNDQLFFRASLILKSTYIDGWLIPQHHSIFQAEQQWQHELELRNVSRATSPQCLRFGMGDCCFRTSSIGSTSPAPRAPRKQLPSHSPHSSISTTTSAHHPLINHTDPSLSLTFNITAPFKLSRPGPHYLVFLERYATEIVARWEMDIGRTIRPSTPVIIKQGAFATQLGPIEEVDDEAEMEAMELQFASMLRLYCMRNWMVLCYDTFDDGSYVEAMSAGVVVPSRGRKLVGKIKDKFGSALAKGRDRVRNVVKVLKPKKACPPPKRLLFGEIDTDSASSLASAGIDSKSVASLLEKDCWVKGLLWYNGVAGQGRGREVARPGHLATSVEPAVAMDEKVNHLPAASSRNVCTPEHEILPPPKQVDVSRVRRLRNEWLSNIKRRG